MFVVKKISFILLLFCGTVFAQSARWEPVEFDLPYFANEDVMADFLDTPDDFFEYSYVDLEFDEGDDVFAYNLSDQNDNDIDNDDWIRQLFNDDLEDIEFGQVDINQENVTRFKYKTVNIDMIKLDGGFFDYGKNGSFGGNSTYVNDFEICSVEVIQKLYMDVMESTPSHNIGKQFPVERINWFDAVYFCNELSIVLGLEPCYSLNGKTDPKKWNYVVGGKKINGDLKCNFSANGFRLPTEVEWEYAARGGKLNRSYKYSGSDDLDEVSWSEYNSFAKSHIVATKKANDLGIYDMSGNVWEWCWDSFAKDATAQEVANTKSNKVIRGGGFSHESYCSLDYRETANPFATFNYVGFRICRTVK